MAVSFRATACCRSRFALLVLALVCSGVTSRSLLAQSSASGNGNELLTTELVLQADAPCLVVVAGEEIAQLGTGEVRRVMLPIGTQHIEAFGEHPDDRWERTVTIEPGIKRVVTIGMKRLIRRREEQGLEEEQRRKAAEERAILLDQARQTLLDPNRYVDLPPGRFQRGGYEDAPLHWVTLTRPIAIGRYEVTQAEWEAIMDTNPSTHKGGHHPVESVSWFEVQAFLMQINTMAPEGLTFRLPTEAEWEYACLAGSLDHAAAAHESSWYMDNAGERSHRVGEKAANAWGLHDMLGNVWEWVDDWYGLYSRKDIEDPISPLEGRARVIRGGSWWSPAAETTCSFRGNLAPDFRATILGFRLVIEAETAEDEMR